MILHRRRMALLLALTAFSGPAVVAEGQPDPRAADQSTIVAGERAWGQAYVTGDPATIQRLLADDFLGVEPHGAAYDKASVLKDVREGPPSTSDAVSEITVRFYGDTAIVQAHEHEIGPAPERKITERVFTDTWIKLQGEWRIVAAEDLDLKAR